MASYAPLNATALMRTSTSETERLFVYGSLQPGGPNEHVLAAIGGRWQHATVRGRLVEAGWGATMGYPALVLDAAGELIEGQVFSSTGLAAHWADLDRFEGRDYARVVAQVALRSGEHVDANVYVLVDHASRGWQPNLEDR